MDRFEPRPSAQPGLRPGHRLDRGRTVFLALSMALAILLAACGGSAATLPVAGQPSAPPLSHVAPDLEAMLPSSLGGVPTVKQSVTGSMLFSTDGWSAEMKVFLQGAGYSPDDLQYAEAGDPTTTSPTIVAAFRVRGMPGSALEAAFLSSSKAETPTLTATNLTVAAREVTHAVYGDRALDAWLYATPDILFEVETADATVAEQVIAGLP